MSTTADAASAHYVTPDELYVGLYVHLDLPWTGHPFAFSSFKIRSAEQIATLQALGLQKIRYSPGRSDQAPAGTTLEAGPAAAEPDEAALQAGPTTGAANSPDVQAALQIKHERLARLALQRQRIQACQAELAGAARTVRSLNQNLFAQPDLTHREAGALVDRIARSMMVDADLSIHLMNDKVAGEEVYHHALNVTVLSLMLARALQLPLASLRHLGTGALFHDIGETDLPARITRKGEALTRAELGVLHTHCGIGVEMARRLKLGDEALDVIGQHHEFADGSGYPQRLHGEQIAPLARLVAITNLYDELCNPYDSTKALTPHEALSVMYGQQRSHFEQAALMSFVRCMGIYPPGTVVVLSNGATGLVTSVNSTRPLKPTVLVHDPEVPRDQAILVDLEQEPDVCVSKTLRPLQLDPTVRDYLQLRKRMTYYFDVEAPRAAA